MGEAETKYARDVHYEVLDGCALVVVGKKRDGTPRHGMAIVVYHFLNESDARRLAREHGRTLFRVDRQRRTELRVKSTSTHPSTTKRGEHG